MTITYGSWCAMNASTGQLIWQTPNPSFGTATGALTLANGVLYAPGGFGGNGQHLYALDALSGNIIWDYTTGETNPEVTGTWGGPSIVDGDVYWGTGMSWGGVPTIFYAFTIH